MFDHLLMASLVALCMLQMWYIRSLVNKIERMRYAGFMGDPPPAPPGKPLPSRVRED